MFAFEGELEILETMQPIDERVFYYVARRMDFDTGITGKTVKISYGGMAFDLSEGDFERRRPETIQTYTRDQIRNSIRRLIGSGVFRSLSGNQKGDNLVLVRVFFESFWGLGNCAKKPDAIADAIADRKELYKIYNRINEIENKNKNKIKPDAIADATTSKDINIKHKADEKSILEPSGSKKPEIKINPVFSMRIDWNPDLDIVKNNLINSGYSPQQIEQKWIGNFCAYWFGQPDIQHNEQKWTAMLIFQIKQYLDNPGYFEQLTAPKVTSDKKKVSKRYPPWAYPPQGGADVLGPWMRKWDYGDGPPGLTLQQTRDWLRSQIEMRKKREGLL